MRAQDAKIEAIRELAQGRRKLAETRDEAARKLAEVERENSEQIAAAEREDVRLYTATTKAGWSADELRQTGFDQPAKIRRATQRRRQNNGAATAAESAGS